MWHWDQGRLQYFEFNTLRRTAAFVVARDFRQATQGELQAAIGMDFAPANYKPWRNYSRVLKLCLLVSADGEIARPTALAKVLGQPGAATCDEYFHFLVQASTEPSPALTGYSPAGPFRYPLLFALKYLLAKAAIGIGSSASFDEIIGAYDTSHFTGDESDEDFISLVNSNRTTAVDHSDPAFRQARESLLVISQISYLYTDNERIFVSLDPNDAQDIFRDLAAITGPFETNGDSEIQRRASLFSGGSVQDFTYPSTVVSELFVNGFSEGGKVKQTHMVIERNKKLRTAFFQANPTTVCDVCRIDTRRTYPWTQGVLDLHHLLPLSSGTRTGSTGTIFDDLVAICPNCHRAVHKYYDDWLKHESRADFQNAEEALAVYKKLKEDFPGHQHE